MAGYWEIWDLVSRNMIADAQTEHEALAIVRDIVDEGSNYSELMLLFDDSDVDVEELPAPITGEELARRTEAAGSDPVRRTA